jgi:hypothetical protein
MLDESLRPSPEAEAVLRWAGWTPDRQVDTTAWVQELRADGNTVFPIAEAIMRSYGGIRLEHRGFGGRSVHDMDVNPYAWIRDREHIELVEEVLDVRVCPLGETAGAAMLAICEDGRVISEMDGSVLLIGQDWPAAMDHVILHRGEVIRLAEDYEPLDPPHPA